MKNADTLKARFGANIRESMGGRATEAAGPLPSASAFHGETSKYQGANRVKDALAIEVDRIVPDPDQPRKEFDSESLEDLAASLKTRGQLQPIRVRWEESMGKWVVIAGERRYRAARLAGLATLICVEAKGSLSAEDILEDQLVENCLREDLKPIEQAHAFKALIDRRGWSQRELAEHLHVGLASVNRALALLDLPTEIQDRVESGALAPSVAYEVSRLDDMEVQRQVAEQIVSERLNREEATEVVRRASPAGGSGRSASKGRGGKAKGQPKVTSRTIRTDTGPRITVEHRRGLDTVLILAALREAVARLETEIEQAEAA